MPSVKDLNAANVTGAIQIQGLPDSMRPNGAQRGMTPDYRIHRVPVVGAGQQNVKVELPGVSFIHVLSLPPGIPNINVKLYHRGNQNIPMRVDAAFPMSRPLEEMFVSYTPVTSSASGEIVFMSMVSIPGAMPSGGIPEEPREIRSSPLDGISGSTERAPAGTIMDPYTFSQANMVDTGDNEVAYTLHTVGAEKYYRIPRLQCGGIVKLDPVTSDSFWGGFRVYSPSQGTVVDYLSLFQLDQTLLDMSQGSAVNLTFEPSTPYENVTATARPHAIQFFCMLSGAGTQFRFAASGRVNKN